MFDYSLPIASRTRQRQDMFFKEFNERKKQQKNVGGSAPTDFKKLGSEYIALSDGSLEDVSSEGFDSRRSVTKGSEKVGKEPSVEVAAERNTRLGFDLSADSVADLDDGDGDNASVEVINLDSDSDDEVVSISEEGGGDPASDTESDPRSVYSDDDGESISDDDGESISDDNDASNYSNDEGRFNTDYESEVAMRSCKVGEGERVGSCLKKKKNSGLDSVRSSQKFNCVAQRTRSRSGTLSEPHYLHSSSGQDVDRDEVAMRGCKVVVGKGVGSCLKRKKNFGLDSVRSGQKFNCVAQRTRSRSGTLSEPHYLHSSSGQDNDRDEVAMRGCKVVVGKGVGSCLKRKKNFGLDSVRSGQKFNCVAQRTRSRSGTLSEPHYLHSSSGQDDDRDGVAMRGCKVVVGKEVGSCLKIKKNFGLDSVRSGQKFNCVAQQTRSRSGTLSEPHYLHSSSGQDDDRDDVYENRCSSQRNRRHEMKPKCKNRRIDDNDKIYTGRPNNGCDKLNDVRKACKKNEGLKKLSKKKCTRAKNDVNVFEILADSIYEDDELLPEGSDSFRDESPKNDNLPLKFSFGEPPSIVIEKSDCEKELDNLFKEMDFALRSAEIGSTDYNVVESNDSSPQVERNDSSPQVERNDSSPLVKEVCQATLCSQGKHHLILDEEIGLICKFCPHVHLEIKYIVPEFASNPYGRSGKRFYEEDNWSIPDELQCHNSDSSFNSHAHIEGTVWDLIPSIKNSMYPHQREGFEFIWSHIAGGIHLEKLRKASSADGGHGCIISHAPGTGKTRLTIVFLQAYMKFNPKCRPLIIAPRTMLLTWEEEFKKWGFDIPFHNLNNQSLSGKENKAALKILVQDRGQRVVKSMDGCRWLKLYSWKRERSILGISYRLFEQLSAAHHSRGKKAGLAKTMRNILLEFPGIVVFDEGHTPRNNKSRMWKASLKIKTNRRIILSGTPFQNSFDELYNTIFLARPDWIRPTCSGRGRKRNVEKAQQTSLSNYIGKGTHDKAKQAKQIRARISPVVHVYRGSILQDTLPGLKNSVVVLQPTKLQKRFSKIIQEKKNLPFFEDEHYETLISVHPSALLNLEKNRMASFLNQVDLDSLKKEKLNPEAGMKAKFVIELIRLSDAMNERVLVFSQYINALTFLRELLKSQFQWTEGEEILSMNGADDEKQRQLSMKAFNDLSSKAKVLLASTKGCNEGISLVGASRVVLLDVTWNPSVERQAICRAYRLGQKKIVYIYHLLLARPREEEKYSRQVEKHKLSELVFSCSDKDGGRKKIRAIVSEDKILEEMVQHEKLEHIFEKITLLDEGSCFDNDKVL